MCSLWENHQIQVIWGKVSVVGGLAQGKNYDGVWAPRSSFEIGRMGCSGGKVLICDYLFLLLLLLSICGGGEGVSPPQLSYAEPRKLERGAGEGTHMAEGAGDGAPCAGHLTGTWVSGCWGVGGPCGGGGGGALYEVVSLGQRSSEHREAHTG